MFCNVLIYRHFDRSPTVWLEFERKLFRPPVFLAADGIGGLFRSLSLSSVWRVVCGQTVQDRSMGVHEVDRNTAGDEISIGTIFDP